ncbi:MAG: hypothetical protein ACOC1K_00055 [Nanoarchaeota archaeon]
MKNYELDTDYNASLDNVFLREGKYFNNVIKSNSGVISEDKEVKIGTYIIEYDKDWNEIKILRIIEISGEVGVVEVLDFVPEKLKSIIENI